MNLFSAREGVQILLPEFPEKTHTRMAMVKIDQKLESKDLPNIQHGYASRQLAIPYGCIEREDRFFVGQVPE